MAPPQETAIKPTYSPTSDELNVAISVALKQEPSCNPKQVLIALQEEHPTWKLPERRVTKFVKKQVKNNKKEQVTKDSITHEDESSVGSQTSMAKRMASSTKKRFGNVMKRVKKKSPSPSTPKPPSHIHTDATAETSIVSPISSVGEDESVDMVTPKKEERAVEVSEEGDGTLDPRDLSIVYEDDNTGEKESQWCGDFCACAIM